MNINQWMIVCMVSVVIIIATGIFIKYIDSSTLSVNTNKYLIAAVIFIIYLGLVFFSSLQIQINELSLKIDKYVEQFHKDIMKKYIDIEDKCSKKLK